MLSHLVFRDQVGLCVPRCGASPLLDSRCRFPLFAVSGDPLAPRESRPHGLLVRVLIQGDDRFRLSSCAGTPPDDELDDDSGQFLAGLFLQEVPGTGDGGVLLIPRPRGLIAERRRPRIQEPAVA